MFIPFLVSFLLSPLKHLQILSLSIMPIVLAIIVVLLGINYFKTIISNFEVEVIQWNLMI